MPPSPGYGYPDGINTSFLWKRYNS